MIGRPLALVLVSYIGLNTALIERGLIGAYVLPCIWHIKQAV
jgi:hypothetical protein